MLNSIHNLIPKAKAGALPVLFGVVACSIVGQFADAQSTTTLRNPYIPNASVTQPNEAAPEGQPPPIGSGMVPDPVPMGDLGAPFAPASQVVVSPTMPGDKDSINAMLGGYLQPPTDLQAQDPGQLPGTTSGYIPPAVVVNINPQGGMPGDNAPKTRWQAQASRDLGYPRTKGSLLTDFGQEPQNANWQESDDGPRPFIFPAPIGSTTNRNPNLPNAQVTQDLYGNRQLFKGQQLRARMTEAAQ